MIGEFPRKLNDALEAECKASLKRGKSVRRNNLLLSMLVLAASIGVIISQQTPAAFIIAVTVAVSALCVVWAVMSLSASLNIHLDLWMKIIEHYAGRSDSP
ncbi:MAG: hypothetical protein QF738_09305 [Rhodospirillales bacterium]|nr:hypothetical protein [Rhodospirillales bacterium]